MITFILLYSNNQIKQKIITSYNLREEASFLRFIRKDSKEIVRLLLSNLVANDEKTFETAREFCLETDVWIGVLFGIFENYCKISENQFRIIAQQLFRIQQLNQLILGLLELCLQKVSYSIKGISLYVHQNQSKNNHKFDLWSLGVMLYELFVELPSFWAFQFYSLIQIIIIDPRKYPKNMSQEFINFLTRLLNLTLSYRLGRILLDHFYSIENWLNIIWLMKLKSLPKKLNYPQINYLIQPINDEIFNFPWQQGDYSKQLQNFKEALPLLESLLILIKELYLKQQKQVRYRSYYQKSNIII
ncbi:unnamed protein product [Paramecium primaurelia]|uniref:non-specific serine/threonine protein kinase n=1 Tax=Paramecium primaurelia TaxID=5886 RepID=A0A8S1K049_PARPR|nr:unnamed protein product [Paramecium primaurelia]